MQFARVVEAYEKIEATTKRLEMTDLLVGLLREIPKEDLDKVVYLTQGRIHPDYEGIELGLAEKMVIRVLVLATGLDDARVQRLWRKRGTSVSSRKRRSPRVGRSRSSPRRSRPRKCTRTWTQSPGNRAKGVRIGRFVCCPTCSATPRQGRRSTSSAWSSGRCDSASRT